MSRQTNRPESTDMPTTTTQLTPQEAVTMERRRRALSIRQAARLGDVSNTAWGDMEAGRAPITLRLQQAVADAFDWPMDWPETMTAPPDSSVIQRLEALEHSLALLVQAVNAMTLRLEQQDGRPDQ